MEYIEIKDGIVIGHYDAPKIPKGKHYKSVECFNGLKGMKAVMLNDKGSVRPLKDLVTEGLIKDSRGQYWDTTTKQLFEITEYGKEPKSNWTDKKPTGMPYEHWNDGNWKDDPNEKAEYELGLIRMKRSSEFALFDKYQLPLPWGELTESQRSEYSSWRTVWLDAPTTGIEPERPEWFH